MVIPPTQFQSRICASWIKPHEVYNLAAQSHMVVSFEIPEYTTNAADALGTSRIPIQ